MITEEKLEESLHRIVATDIEAAEKKVDVERKKFVMNRDGCPFYIQYRFS